MCPCKKLHGGAPVFGHPKGLPDKIIRLPGGLVHACRRFSVNALSTACKDGVASRAIALRKQKDGDAQGYNPANTGAAWERPFVFPAKALSSSASNLPSHAPPA